MINETEKNLDVFFTEMVTSVMESLRLFPCTLACLQIVVIEISITETMFYPNTLTAAWRRAERINRKLNARVKEQAFCYANNYSSYLY